MKFLSQCVVSSYISLVPNDVEDLPVLIGHLCIFGQIAVQILCPFRNWIMFLLLTCENSSYLLDNRPLSDTWFVNIFSHFIGCLVNFVDGMPLTLNIHIPTCIHTSDGTGKFFTKMRIFSNIVLFSAYIFTADSIKWHFYLSIKISYNLNDWLIAPILPLILSLFL